VANQQAGPEARPTAEETRRPRAAGARKPGAIARMVERCRASVEHISLPPADWRTFGWGLLVLIVLAFIIRNWAPVRISLFGWYLDAPRAVVFVIIFLLGMLTAWLLEVRGRRAAAAGAEASAADEEADEQAAAEQADELAPDEEAEEAEEAEPAENEVEAVEADDLEFDEAELAQVEDDLAAEAALGDEDPSI